MSKPYLHRRSPKPPTTFKVKKIDGPLPSDPLDPRWNKIDSNFFPLGGQIIRSKKVKYPIIDNVIAKSVHNGKEISFYLHWDDPTFDPILKKSIHVEESPVPPLPLHLQVNESEKDILSEEYKPQEFPDSIAIQFPISMDETNVKPYFLNGDREHPVNLWKWSSHPNESNRNDCYRH